MELPRNPKTVRDFLSGPLSLRSERGESSVRARDDELHDELDTGAGCSHSMTVVSYRPPAVAFLLAALFSIASRPSVQQRPPRGRGGEKAPPPSVVEPSAERVLPPGPLDVKIPPTIVHQDTTGGTNQVLRDLAAGDKGGFAVVWQDQRDGLLGVEVRRIAPDGAPLEPEQALHDCISGRSTDPTVALAPDGSGAVAWISSRSYLAPRVWLRAFDVQGRFQAPARPVEVAKPGKGAGRGPGAGASKPVIARRREGGFAVAWIESSGVRMLETDGAGVWKDRPGTVCEAGGKPLLSVELGSAAAGGVLCAFTSVDGWLATAVGRAATAPGAGAIGPPRPLGPGELLRVEPDPAVDPASGGAGFWSWFKTDAGYELRHLGPAGDPDRDPLRPFGTAPAQEPKLARADFAVGRNGIAVLGVPESGPLVLRLLDARGEPLDPEPMRVTSSDAVTTGDGRVASNGRILYVAWTDRRNGDADVYGRTLDPSAPPERRLGDETRLNSDIGSSDQIRASIASSGAQAIVAWEDHREPRAQVFARRFAVPAGSPSDEFRIGGAADVARTRPAVALQPTGEAFLAWTEAAPDGANLRALVLSSGATGPGSSAAGGDAGVLLQPVSREPSRVATAALPDRRGFLALFDVPGTGDVPGKGEIRLARVGIGGELLAPPQRVGGGEGDTVADPALALLSDGRAIACWSRQAKDKTWSIAARFLDADGAPAGDEIAIEPSPRRMDWEPAVAAGKDGGFLLAWTAGTREAAVRGEEWRDVVARSFDAQGTSRGPLLALSTSAGEQDHPEIARLADGSFAVAWEDDLSGQDQVHARRVLASETEIGPTARLSAPSKGCALDHQSPHIAPLGEGLAALWSSSERSKGWDVVLAVFGSRFDGSRPRTDDAQSPSEASRPR